MNEGIARCVVEAGNELGEGVLWCARAQALYWTDIQSAELWRYHPADGRVEHWPMPERVGCFALCERSDWLLLGLATRLAFLHLPSGRMEPVCGVEPTLPTRINDGACDRQGRFVFGTLHEPDEGGPQRPIGAFYRLNTDLSLERLPLGGVAISNSLAFSPDGRTLYYCDTPQRVIHHCDYGDTVGASRVLVDLQGMSGAPDGSTVDADGGLWNAQWGMGRVVRYTPDGRQDRVIAVPARQVTRPAFGGADLTTLYVTSARENLVPAALEADPQAGHLFAVDGVGRGLPEPRFAGRR